MSSSNVITFPANPDAALPVAPTKRARGKAAKTPLAELNFKPIDVRKLLLSGQCDPSIKLPADIIKAIDQQDIKLRRLGGQKLGAIGGENAKARIVGRHGKVVSERNDVGVDLQHQNAAVGQVTVAKLGQ